MVFLTAALIMIPAGETPVYTLEPAGIDFYYLPEYLDPLIEGVLTEETGALAAQPNTHGVTFACQYWRMDTPISEKNLWIEEKISSAIPPNLMENIRTSGPTWAEGSRAAEVSPSRSLGLMAEISFTFLSQNGILGKGRSYGIFRNGYAVLLTLYGPSELNPHEILDQIVGMAALSE